MGNQYSDSEFLHLILIYYLHHDVVVKAEVIIAINKLHCSRNDELELLEELACCIAAGFSSGNNRNFCYSTTAGFLHLIELFLGPSEINSAFNACSCYDKWCIGRDEYFLHKLYFMPQKYYYVYRIKLVYCFTVLPVNYQAHFLCDFWPKYLLARLGHKALVSWNGLCWYNANNFFKHVFQLGTFYLIFELWTRFSIT